MGDERFSGTWALVATEWRRADGRHANPFGDGATGILTYDEAGHVSAQIMRADRPSAAVTHAGIDTAAATAVPGYIAYFGTFEVDRARRVVTHHVLASAFPAWVGRDHARSYRFEGNQLTLSADVMSADGVAVAAATTWRRLA